VANEQKTNENELTVNAHIYTQDCEFYRYLESLKWSRFKTISVIEGAILFALFIKQITITLDIKILIIAGTLLTLLLSIFAFRDINRQGRFLERIKNYENETFRRTNQFLKKITDNFVLAAAVIINLVNIWLIVRYIICK
jgi:hypothetical protein